VGTGSGILATCAARQLPQAHVWGTDISPAALAVAGENLARHQLADRVTLLEGQLLQPLPEDTQLDFVVSNPPYVSTAEWEALPHEVRDHEPRQALVAGERGDEVIIPLVAESAARLVPGGSLIFEISPMLQSHVAQWFAQHPEFESPTVTKDLAQLPRVVTARRRT
jgi:release factor glutamine methyltransferase